jgi:NAD-dependent deacetylase
MYRIVAFTGAGISKASGIPTFAEMGDLREKLSRDYFNRYTEDFYRILNQMRRTCDQAKPNPAHLAIARYDVPVVTMNIDGLHKRAGSTNIVEIHGCLDYLYCDCCQKRYSYDVLEESIYCKSCHEKLQPNVVLYGYNIPLYSEAAKLVTNTKELLVIGTSFYTSTSWIFTNMAEAKGAKITLINESAEIKVPEYLKQIFEGK